MAVYGTFFSEGFISVVLNANGCGMLLVVNSYLKRNQQAIFY